jgi:hypothetical protein
MRASQSGGVGGPNDGSVVCVDHISYQDPGVRQLGRSGQQGDARQRQARYHQVALQDSTCTAQVIFSLCQA